MTCKEQEELWVKGESIHNKDVPGGGECCPDFSCCNPDMKWPEEKRLAFAAGDDTTRRRMMIGALGQLMDYHERRGIRIIG